MSEWISVKDRLPEKIGYYLCYLDNDTIKVCKFTCGIRNDSLYWRWDNQNWTAVTHWMQLPEPPKEESK